MELHQPRQLIQNCTEAHEVRLLMLRLIRVQGPGTSEPQQRAGKIALVLFADAVADEKSGLLRFGLFLVFL